MYYICFVMCSRLPAEGDTADRKAVVSRAVVRGADSVQTKVQDVGTVAIAADRGPVDAVVACAAQAVAWVDVAASDKHQRRLHNSIRIS